MFKTLAKVRLISMLNLASYKTVMMCFRYYFGVINDSSHGLNQHLFFFILCQFSFDFYVNFIILSDIVT